MTDRSRGLNPNEAVTPEIDATPRDRGELLLQAGVFVAAVLARLPAQGAWWNQDDWGLLARAAGLDGLSPVTGFPARWLSQHAYWQVTWPLFGLNADAHSLIRIVLHALSAVLVTRIGRRAGLAPLPRYLAGLLFAASPLAFTPLYWAAGIQELMGGFFALLAVERWLAGREEGRKALAWAAAATVLSILSKEMGLGLPLLFLVFAWLGIGVDVRDKAFAWAMILLLIGASVAGATLVFMHFPVQTGELYATGGAMRVILNLGVYGYWLGSIGPIFRANQTGLMILAGQALFLVWLGWGVWCWKRGLPGGRREGHRIPLLALFAGLLALAPALPLARHHFPYLAYTTEAAGALALVTLLPARFKPKPTVMLVLGLLAVGYGFAGMRSRLVNRDNIGLVADPVGRATSLSWEACNVFRNLRSAAGPAGIGSLTLLQPLVDPRAAADAAKFGERWVRPSKLHHALQGTLAPRLILGDDMTVTWVSGLVTNPPEALVLCETATGFRNWGRTYNALLYAALTDAGLGHFPRTWDNLVRASQLADETVMFAYDEGQMVIPLDMVISNKEAFVDWTLHKLSHDASPHMVGGVQEMFFNLLSSASGIPVEDLTAGSELIMGDGKPTNPGD